MKWFICLIAFCVVGCSEDASQTENKDTSSATDFAETPDTTTATIEDTEPTTTAEDVSDLPDIKITDAPEDTQDAQDAIQDTTPEPEPPPLFPIERCNGRAELCGRRLDEVTLPGTHNAMSNLDDAWIGANQTHGLLKQLEDGVRVMLLDIHPWRGEIYLCHGYCQLGKRLLLDGLNDIERFMKYHPHEVVVLFFEDYVSAAETVAVFDASGLTERVHTQNPDEPWPTLQTMIESGRRLVVLVQDAGPPPDWYHSGWSLAFDTNYTYERVEDFDCSRNRGNGSASLFMVNHWLGAPLPTPELAAQTNTREVLLDRAQACDTNSERVVVL